MIKKIKLFLVFDDWRKLSTGQSIYGSQEDIDNELSLGIFHSGTTFNAEIEVDIGHDKTIAEALALGIVPVFWAEVKPEE